MGGPKRYCVYDAVINEFMKLGYVAKKGKLYKQREPSETKKNSKRYNVSW